MGKDRLTLTGRADLVSLGLDEVGPSDHKLRQARLLGFFKRDDPETEISEPGHADGDREATEDEPKEQGSSGQEPAPVSFVQPVHFRALAPERSTSRDAPRPTASPNWLNRPAQPPVFEPLADLQELALRISTLVSYRQDGRKPDMPRWTRQLASLDVTRRIPMRQASLAPATLQIVADRSRHLVPLWEDQLRLLVDLEGFLPGTRIRPLVFNEADCRLTDPLRDGAPVEVDPGDGPILVLGDLGLLGPSGTVQFWQDLGARFAMAGSVAAALLPVSASRVPEKTLMSWRVMGWDNTSSPENQSKHRDRLLELAAPALRLEPGLLRELRRKLLPDAGVDVELAAWNSSALVSHNATAATFAKEARDRLRLRFARMARNPETQAEARAALDIIRKWHGAVDQSIWFEELIDLPQDLRDLLDPEDVEHALAFWREVSDLASDSTWAKANENAVDWLRRVGGRALAEGGLEEPAFRDAILSVSSPETAPAVGPGKGPAVQDIERLFLRHVSDGLEACAELKDRGSLLFQAGSEDGEVELEPLMAPFPGADHGVDRYGRWASFAVEGVTVRLRWCPPGRFLMGSPEDEPGRYDYEGPQTEVTFDEGFWMMETPVTQALWQAVMGENPSYFVTPDRPVERVSWEDAQEFAEKLNQLVPGASLALPSEAKWEYACRAGTQTALWTGHMEILGENNVPALDTIAWYAGNSGHETDLEDGWDSSKWADKQYDHTVAGTRRVAGKAANPWGLYDMVGNVWEWCEDAWSEDHGGAASDGAPRQASQIGRRVLRGGSWSSGARDCRAAYRGGSSPDDRSSAFGFRLARGQARAQASQQGRAERAGQRPGKGHQAEPRPQPAAALLRQLYEELTATAQRSDVIGHADLGLSDLEKMRRVQDDVERALMLDDEALLLIVTGRSADAVQRATEAVTIFDSFNEDGDDPDLDCMHARTTLGLANLAIGTLAEAERHAEQVIEDFKEWVVPASDHEVTRNKADAYVLLAAIRLRQNRPSEALDLATQGETLILRAGMEASERLSALCAITASLCATGQESRAESDARIALEAAALVQERLGRLMAPGGDAERLSELLRSLALAMQVLNNPSVGETDSPVLPPKPTPLERQRVIPGRPARLRLPDAPFVLRTDRAELTVGRVTLSDLDWADAAGRDRFGLWARCRDTEQKMRWIPPGRFLMGSPEDEPGRFENEGPQVPVTLAQGYWLADAPVTVGLWRSFIQESGYAMPMGAVGWSGEDYGHSERLGWADPGFDQEEDAPVTCVAWEDAVAFVEWRNEGRRADETWRLPSEAEWEYACRAGTETALWTGPIEILGDNNAPALDPISWYGGNSGLGYEGKRGASNKDWEEKQYPHEKAGTHTVRGKAANHWGLYDMIGNVWEWSDDVWTEGHESAASDGSPWQGSRTEPRVLRGGSWLNFAGKCRAACRFRAAPAARYNFIGFRLARGQARAQASRPDRAERGEGPEAGPLENDRVWGPSSPGPGSPA